jgi:hypothetical protein
MKAYNSFSNAILNNRFTPQIRSLILIVSIFFGVSLINAQAIESGDWSRVRLYGHAYNLNDFSTYEYDWIKNNNEFFTIEKRHAKNIYGAVSSERASVATAANIIANNANAKPLFYWNTGPVYSDIYETIQTALIDHPEWVDSESNRWTYDDAEFRTWFVDVVKDMVNNQGHSGVFLDAVMTLQGHTSLAAANYCLAMMDEMPGIVIYNGFAPVPTRIHAGLDYLDHADGTFVEHFFRAHCDSFIEGEMMMDELLQVPNEKIIIVNSQPEDTFWKTTDHKFSLAAFLIIANDNSYYHYFSTELYDSEYMTYWHSDFEQEIGAPLGKATKTGYVYTRSFENANVTVDLENKTSTIEWITIKNPDTYWYHNNETNDYNAPVSSISFGTLETSQATPSTSGNRSTNVSKFTKASGAHSSIKFNLPGNIAIPEEALFKIKIYTPTNSTITNNNIRMVLRKDGVVENQMSIIKTITEFDNWVEYTFDFSAIAFKEVFYNEIYLFFASPDTDDDADGNVYYFDAFEGPLAGILSVDNNQHNNKINLYPNPVNNSFEINSGNQNIKNVKVYSINGRLLKSLNSAAKYDISDLNSGLYLTVINTASGQKTIKLIKQ